MAIRTGMASLVRQLRGYAAADENEYTLAGETYWSDDHLQDKLDENRADILSEQLSPAPEYDGAQDKYTYFAYYFANGNPEEAASGTTAWVLKDGDGNNVSTANYTVNYAARQVRFNTDTQGASGYYLTYRAYDVYKAASEVWSQKAANVANRFDVRTDNHDLKRSQLMDMALRQATYYANLSRKSNTVASGGGFKEWKRVDLE